MAKEVLREKERPVTMEGFREFGHKQGVTIKHYFDNKENYFQKKTHFFVYKHIFS